MCYTYSKYIETLVLLPHNSSHKDNLPPQHYQTYCFPFGFNNRKTPFVFPHTLQYGLNVQMFATSNCNC